MALRMEEIIAKFYFSSLPFQLKLNLGLRKYMSFITDRVRSTTGRLCFDTCLSVDQFVCPHLGGYPGQVQAGGGYPSQIQLGGYPTLGIPPVSPGWGVPHLGYPLIRPGQEGTPMGGGIPPWLVLDMPRSVCLLRSRRRTFLFFL